MSFLCSLLSPCRESHCEAKAQEFLKLLSVPQYEQGQAMRDLDHAEGRTMRKRADRAAQDYYVAEYEPRDYYDDTVDINRSAPARQGRPMAPHYINPARTGLVGAPACHRHHTLCYGVFDKRGAERLRAYSTVHRVGELVMLSMFLGHRDHLESHVMYLLAREIAKAQLALGGGGILYYNRWDSGTDGLRFFKSKIGMYEDDIEWTLSTSPASPTCSPERAWSAPWKKCSAGGPTRR